jgi:hypothetical protein
MSVSVFRGRLAPGLIISVLLATSWTVSVLASQTKPLILKSVQVSSEGDAVVVVIEADGPLPMPTTGRLDSPARFFLDFPGVIAGTRGSGDGSAPVTRVRVALNSSNPPVTRVVLDLAQQGSIQVEADARDSGRIRILVGGSTRGAAETPLTPSAEPKPAGEPAAVPLIPIPPSPSEPAPVEARPTTAEPPRAEPPRADPLNSPPVPEPLPPVAAMPPAVGVSGPEKPASPPPKDLPLPAVYPVRSGTPPSKASAGDLNKYREQIMQPLNRLRVLRPLLTQIDRQESAPPDGLPAARSEFSAVIRVLAGVRPPEALTPTHEMLLRAASLSMMASTLRADTGTRADPTAIRNASSAAAGALLLLDRVCIEIGCPELPDRK